MRIPHNILPYLSVIHHSAWGEPQKYREDKSTSLNCLFLPKDLNTFPSFIRNLMFCLWHGKNHSVVVLGLTNGIFVVGWKSPAYQFLSIYLYGFRNAKQRCIKLSSNCLCPVQIFLPLHKQLLKYKEYYISLEHHRTRLSWGNSCEYFIWKHLISLHCKQSPGRWWGGFLSGRVLVFLRKVNIEKYLKLKCWDVLSESRIVCKLESAGLPVHIACSISTSIKPVLFVSKGKVAQPESNITAQKHTPTPHHSSQCFQCVCVSVTR